MLSEFTQWLLGLVKQLFVDAWSFVTDAFVWLVDALLGVLGSIIAVIPVPAFMSTGLQSIFGQLDGTVWYFCAAVGLPAALSIVGSGYAFRLARKVATLFQW